MTHFPSSSRQYRNVRSTHASRTRMFVVVVFLGVGLWHLVAANASVVASYRLSDAIAQRELLVSELEERRAALAAAISPEMLEERALDMGFTPVTRAAYLAIPGTTVAIR